MDSVTLKVVWTRLQTIADEMTSTLIRTAFSTFVTESKDCACILLDANGDSLAQSSSAMPAFTGTMPITVKAVLQEYGSDDLNPGDVLISNDPWIGAGHLPDMTIVRPIFDGADVIAFAASTAHLPDIGGRVWSADCNEVYEEGLRLPPVKLLESGESNVFLWEKVVFPNVRYPQQVYDDIMAQVGATEVGERRLRELIAKYGINSLPDVADSILALSESAMRAAISEVPDGSYSKSVRCDGFDNDLDICVQVHVDGSEIRVTFDGTSEQQPWGINSVWTYTRAYACYALKCLLAPDVPNNEGSLRPIEIDPPEGSVLNPNFPAPVGGRHLTAIFVPGAIFGALASVSPGRVMAESGLVGSPYFGLRPKQGPPRAQFFSTNGGLGAREGLDGLHTASFPTNVSNVPIEVVEQRSGLVVHFRELIPDSGGAGKWRGGLGQRHCVQVPEGFDGQATVSILSDRTRHAANGLGGGEPGSKRRNILNGETELHPKRRTELKSGDTVETRMPGGGGVGPPEERARSAVEADLRNGYVTVAEAMKVYGYNGDVPADPYGAC